MTAICGGGPSSVKPGFGTSVLVDAGLITAGLELISPWLTPVAAYIDGFLYDTSTNCATDPPAMPTWSLSDLQNIIGGVLNPNFGTAMQKLNDTLMNYLWYQWCQCNSGSPTPFKPPAQPSGVTAPSNPLSASCYSGSWSGTTRDETAGQPIDGTANVAAYVGTPVVVTLSFPNTHAIRLNTPLPLHQKVTATVDGSRAGSGAQYGFVSEFYDSTGSFISGIIGGASVPPSSGTITQTLEADIPTNAFYQVVDFLENGSTYYGLTGTMNIDYTCAGGSPTTPQQPCLPDPAIIGLLQQINAMVTLIQRQVAPFAYNTSTVHAGLSGSGQISVQGLLGVKITPTSIPPGSGLVVGDPDSLWLDSWIRWGNADGWSKREFLTASPYVSLPILAGQYTKIGYTLMPGLVCDIEELVREP